MFRVISYRSLVGLKQNIFRVLARSRFELLSIVMWNDQKITLSTDALGLAPQVGSLATHKHIVDVYIYICMYLYV